MEQLFKDNQPNISLYVPVDRFPCTNPCSVREPSLVTPKTAFVPTRLGYCFFTAANLRHTNRNIQRGPHLPGPEFSSLQIPRLGVPPHSMFHSYQRQRNAISYKNWILLPHLRALPLFMPSKVSSEVAPRANPAICFPSLCLTSILVRTQSR